MRKTWICLLLALTVAAGVACSPQVQSSTPAGDSPQGQSSQSSSSHKESPSSSQESVPQETKSWADVEDSFYSGTQLMDTASISLGDDQFSPIANRFFPVYTAPSQTQEELAGLLTPIAQGTANFAQSLTLNTQVFGFLSQWEENPGVVHSEHICFFTGQQPSWAESTVSTNGLYQGSRRTGVATEYGCRISLSLDQTLASQLEEMGFSPADTTAKAFCLHQTAFDYTLWGVLFENGVQEAVVLSKVNLPDGGTGSLPLDGQPRTGTAFAQLVLDHLDELLVQLDPQTGDPVA